MKIAIRVDSSRAIGSGHLVRCKTLAERLPMRGAQVRFICRQHAGNLIHWLSRAEFPVTVLPASDESDSLEEDYAAWLGVPPALDAAQTIEALSGQLPDWLIVDHYGIDRSWEQQLRPHVERIFAIDDLANRAHDCDLLLDQNANTDGERRYRSLVPDTCRLIVGPRYALLRPEYRTHRQTRPPQADIARQVLVFFGSTDTHDMTGQTLAALSEPEFSDVRVDVVVGATNPRREALERQAAARPHTQTYLPRPHLADLMAKADLAIGSGGTVSWERCCLGLPTLVVSVAENQVSACQALEAEGAIAYLGAASTTSQEQMSSQFQKYFNESSLLKGLSLTASLQVDGRGGDRVSEYLVPTPNQDLELRGAEEEDSMLYFDWANDPSVRENSFNSEIISWKTHENWFQSKLIDPHCYLGVLEANGLPVGQIRFDIEGESALINYSLDRLVRGRRWSSHLLCLGAKLLSETKVKRLRAKVKRENAASRLALLRSGFQKVPIEPLNQPRNIDTFQVLYSDIERFTPGNLASDNDKGRISLT